MNLKLSIVNYQLSIFVATVTFFALPLKAQVTIGAQKAPHSYSVLELESTKGGFRLFRQEVMIFCLTAVITTDMSYPQKLRKMQKKLYGIMRLQRSQVPYRLMAK